MSASLLLIAGSNAFPSLPFTVAGGKTQTVCVPFQLLAAAADVDGAVTNLAVLLDGAAWSPTVELEFPGAYTFTARADDNAGGTSWATQAVTLAAYPLHWSISGGFRTNGAFKLCMAGEPGRVYQVLGSTNLGTTNWQPIGVMEFTNGIWRFLDTGASNQPYRFYRAEQVLPHVSGYGDCVAADVQLAPLGIRDSDFIMRFVISAATDSTQTRQAGAHRFSSGQFEFLIGFGSDLDERARGQGLAAGFGHRRFEEDIEFCVALRLLARLAGFQLVAGLQNRLEFRIAGH